ncbi:MAG: SCO family protein [Gammaproteobacteria bacterium]
MLSRVSVLKKLAVVLIAVMAMAAGFWMATQLTQPASVNLPQIQGSVVNPARQIVVPDLIKHDGEAFMNEDLNNQWTLIFFGYTHCPDICPITMNVLAEAKKKATGDFPQVVFISVDPQRDTVDLLGDYVHYFDPAFIGVTGDEKMIQALTLQTSVVYMRVPGASGSENDYLVDHSSAVLLINPKGQLAAFLQAPHTPSSILDSVAKIKAVY